MERQTLLIRGGTVLPFGREARVLSGSALLIRDGLVERIAPEAEIREPYERLLDASGMVVMPGFINAHTHFYSAMACGIGGLSPSVDFLSLLQNLWWRLDRSLTLEHCYYSALASSIQAIRHGVTTMIDHHSGPNAIPGSLECIASAVRKTGARACLCYEVSDRNGEAAAHQGLEENSGFLTGLQSGKDPLLRGLFGLHASFTLSDATLQRAAELGRGLRTGFHIHVAESRCDQEQTRERFGCGVVERLEKHGILGPQTIAAHAVHLDEKEVILLAESETMVVHNPQSNMNNAVGICDLIGLQQGGVLVGLGTDAMTMNMTEELRVALWAQHLRRNHPSIGFMETMDTLLRNNAIIARRLWDQNLGELAEGTPADLICIPYLPITPLNEENIYGHMLFGLSQEPVDTVLVDGKVLMHRRKLEIGMEEAELATRSRELAGALWKRMKENSSL